MREYILSQIVIASQFRTFRNDLETSSFNKIKNLFFMLKMFPSKTIARQKSNTSNYVVLYMKYIFITTNTYQILILCHCKC